MRSRFTASSAGSSNSAPRRGRRARPPFALRLRYSRAMKLLRALSPIALVLGIAALAGCYNEKKERAVFHDACVKGCVKQGAPEARCDALCHCQVDKLGE